MRHAARGLILLPAFLTALGCRRSESDTSLPEVARRTPKAPPVPAARILPGEYERVRELLVSWDGDYEDFFASIVVQASRQTRVTVLLDDRQVSLAAMNRLTRDGAVLPNVRIVSTPVKSMWLRDFGPLVTRTPQGQREIVDFAYRDPSDDDLPGRLGSTHWRGWQRRSVAFPLEGGALLSNGQGICVTTDRVLNDLDAAERQTLARHLLTWLGCRNLVEVPAIEGEETGHVDMLMTITGPNEVIVGTFSAARDSENAPRLDLAAERMRDRGFRVRRIPMPEHTDEVVRSYTNALAVNDSVLVPVYQGDEGTRATALSVFAQAFPGRQIVPIDATEIIKLHGAIHCVALTVAN